MLEFRKIASGACDSGFDDTKKLSSREDLRAILTKEAAGIESAMFGGELLTFRDSIQTAADPGGARWIDPRRRAGGDDDPVADHVGNGALPRTWQRRERAPQVCLRIVNPDVGARLRTVHRAADHQHTVARGEGGGSDLRAGQRNVRQRRPAGARRVELVQRGLISAGLIPRVATCDDVHLSPRHRAPEVVSRIRQARRRRPFLVTDGPVGVLGRVRVTIRRKSADRVERASDVRQ